MKDLKKGVPSLTARFLLIAGGNFFRQIAAFSAQLVVAQRCGASAFGLITMAFSSALLMAGLGDFGMRLYFWRTVAMEPTTDRYGLANRFLWQHFVFSLWPLVPLNLVIGLTTSGAVEFLLHLSTLACVFSQATFDWWFFSQERYYSLTAFNALSGLLLIGACLGMVHGPADGWIFIASFSLSFAIPGLALTALGRPLPTFRDLRGIVDIPRRTVKFLSYDWTQRLYTAFPPLVAAMYFGRIEIGQFRLALLFYGLVFTLASYLGSAMFNQVARAREWSKQQAQFASVAEMLLLLVLPFSASAKMGADFVVGHFMSKVYAAALPCLDVLMPFLFLPAVTNFLREAFIGAGRPLLSTGSYLATILTICLVLAVFHRAGIISLSWALLAGEAVGCLILVGAMGAAPLRHSLFRRSLIAAVTFFLITWIFETIAPAGLSHAHLAFAVVCILAASALAALSVGATLMAEQFAAGSRSASAFGRYLLRR